MSIKWSIQNAGRFGEFADAWDGLNGRYGRVPFLDSLFIQPLLEVFAKGDEQLALGYRNEELVAAAIVTRAGFGRWVTFQPSQMPLGPLLILPELELEKVSAGLLRALPGTNLALGLTQLDPLLAKRPAATPNFASLDYIQTAWVDIAGGFDDYWALRGKNLRQNMRKQRNKLATDGVEVALDVLRSADSVEEAIRQYGVLETGSWKSEEGTAVSLDNEQGRFYKAMLESFCRAGRGVIYRYRFGDHIVAMDLCIESGDLMVILKTSYDSSNKNLSPAFLMREEQFQQLFSETKIRRVEFYGKLMEWHTRWTEQGRTLYHANIYRHGLIPKLLAMRSKLRKTESTEAKQLAPENT